MSSSTRIRVARPDERLSDAAWRRWEQVGLKPTLELDELTLNWVNPSVRDLDARGALTAITLDRTIEGGSTVTITLSDPEHQLFEGRRVRDLRAEHRTATALYRQDPVAVDEAVEPIFSRRAMEVELDGVVFRLVKVRASHASGQVDLTFEDRIVYWLKRKRGERRATRGSCTRAEFLLSLLREVEAARGLYRFVCPELHARQPIDRGTSPTSGSPASTGTDDESTRGGFPANVALTVKGVKATPEQLRNLHGVLSECQARGCSRDVMVATICCVIQESMAKRLGYGDAAGPDSRGLFQQRAPWGPMGVRLDPRGSTGLFLTGGRGGQKGWKQANDPKLHRVPGSIETAVKRVQISVGGYQQHASEATRIVRAWGGATDEGNAAQTTSYAKSYQFARNADEDSWTAMQRLAGEVGWRCFVVGNSVYYMSEQDLYARRARYAVTPDDPAILDATWDVDWGKPVSELELDVVLERWGAPPGSIVLVDGFGPPDGRWLVTSVSRDYFAPNATVTLKQPGKELLEPANERATRASNAVGGTSTGTTADDGTKAGRVYAAARSISGKGYPYVWGGGHAHCGTPDRGTGRDPGIGYDCSGSVCAALAAAGLGYRIGGPADGSGTMAAQWGKPGRGDRFTVWANSGHVWIQFHGMGAWRFDTSQYGSGPRGPHLRTTPRPTSGFVARHWPGC